MTNELPNTSIKSETMKEKGCSKTTFEPVKVNPQRSKAFSWLIKNYELLNNNRIYWDSILKEFENLGIKNKFDDPYSKPQIKRVWQDVKTAKRKEDTLRTTKFHKTPVVSQSSSSTFNPTPSISTLPAVSSFKKEEELSPEEIEAGERNAKEQTEKILAQLEERDRRR